MGKGNAGLLSEMLAARGELLIRHDRDHAQQIAKTRAAVEA